MLPPGNYWRKSVSTGKGCYGRIFIFEKTKLAIRSGGIVMLMPDWKIETNFTWEKKNEY